MATWRKRQEKGPWVNNSKRTDGGKWRQRRMAKLSNAPKPDQSHERNQGSLYSVSSNSTKSVDDKLERMNTTQSRERLFLKQQLQIQAMPQDSTLIMHCTVNHAPILASLQSSTLALSLTSLVFYSLTAWIRLALLSEVSIEATSLLSSTLSLALQSSTFQLLAYFSPDPDPRFAIHTTLATLAAFAASDRDDFR